jgi:hypothetical protein
MFNMATQEHDPSVQSESKEKYTRPVRRMKVTHEVFREGTAVFTYKKSTQEATPKNTP